MRFEWDKKKNKINIGLIHPRVAVVVYTERLGDMIRIISARKATRREAKHYEKALQD